MYAIIDRYRLLATNNKSDTNMSQHNKQMNTQALKTMQSSLIDAAQVGNIEVIQELIVNGAKVNSQDASGLTPLH